MQRHVTSSICCLCLAMPRHSHAPLVTEQGALMAYNCEQERCLPSTKAPLISMQIEKAHRIMYSLDPKAVGNGKANVVVSRPKWDAHPSQPYIHHETVSPRYAKSSRNARDNGHNRPQCFCACSSLHGELCGSNLFLYVYMHTLMYTWCWCQLASLHWLFGLVA